MFTNLALHGGTPIREKLLPYGRHLIDKDDEQAVLDVLRSEWLTTGPIVPQYEQEFADYVGAKYAIAFSSGTAALHGAAFAIGLGPGDEAITTPMTFVASANCILYQGARPIFADVQADTLNINPDEILRQITARTRTIIPVDYSGQPADIDTICEIASRNNLSIIEDAAHALGATYCGRRVGVLATMTVFSTHPVKLIATGEGGMVTTDNQSLAKKLRMFRNHGLTTELHERQIKGGWFYEMAELGYNYRLSDIQAALGRSQLGKADEWLARREAIAQHYHQALGGIPTIGLPPLRENRKSAWHLYVIRLNLQSLRVGRAVIFKALRAENIGVNVHYIPVHLHPYYQRLGYHIGECPIAEAAYETLITLPLFPSMTDDDVADVIKAVRKVTSAFLLEN